MQQFFLEELSKIIYFKNTERKKTHKNNETIAISHIEL
jgi:hypothetical protein